MTRRRSRLPRDWEARRKHILNRDGWRCTIGIPGCLGDATEVHHTKAHDYHEPDGLVAICSRCHATITGKDARASRRDIAPRKRKPEQHPGWIEPDDAGR